MSKDGEFLASSGAGFGPSPTTAILETQVGVPTSSESDVFPSVVQDRVPPRGPGTTVDTDSTLSRGKQGSLAPSLPVSVSADSAIPTPGGSRRHSGSAARGTDRHSSTASVRPLADVLSRRSSDLECLDELARHESDSSGAGRKRSASPSHRSSRRDVTAHVGATPPGMIRGELTGALYADSRASDRFPRKASSSSTGRRHREDAPTLRPPDKSGAPTGSSSVKRQSRSDAKRQDSSPPRRVVSRTPPPRSYGAYKEGCRSRSKSPHCSSRRRRQRSHRSRARPRCSETHDSRSRGRSEAGRGHREPSAYDKPPGPHGVERRRPSPPVFGHQSGVERIAEGALSQVALQQRKLKKQAKDKERELQKRLHDIDVATEEKIQKVDRGDHCAFSPVFYDVPQSQDSSLHPPDPRPGSSVVVTPDASSHYYSFPSPPPGRQVVVHDYETTQSLKITVPATRSATVTCEPRPVPSLAQLSRFRPEDIPADAIVTPVLPLTDTKLISALDTPLVSTTTALPAYSPVPLLPPASVSPADPPPWYRQLVADAVSAFRAQLPNIPPVSAAATITSPDEGVDVSSPPDVPVTKAVKPPPKLVKQPKRFVPDDELSVDGSDGDDAQSVGARSTKRRREDSDTETPEALTLTDAKRWAYQNLVRTCWLVHLLLPMSWTRVILGIPLQWKAKALVRHNRVMQAIDKEVFDSEVDCSKKPILSITNDADSTTKGFFLAKHKCHRLKVGTHCRLHSTPLVTDRPVPVDQDMLALVSSVPPPLATLHLWEEMERVGRALLAIGSLNQCFMAASRHHMEAVRLSRDAPPEAPQEWKVALDFTMMRRLSDSLAEAQRHTADLAVKIVANSVLVRRNTYLAKSGLSERVKKPLRSLPIESRTLFGGRMVEALDADTVEKKHNPSKSRSQSSNRSCGSNQSAAKAKTQSSTHQASSSSSSSRRGSGRGRGKSATRSSRGRGRKP